MHRLLLVLVVLAGCTADPPEPPWHGRELDGDPPWRSTVLEARQAFELDFDRAAGEALAWDWFVDEQMVAYFEVHTHSGGQHRTFVQTYADQNVSQVQADIPGTYSMMWGNPHGDNVTLWYQVPPDGRAA